MICTHHHNFIQMSTCVGEEEEDWSCSASSRLDRRLQVMIQEGRFSRVFLEGLYRDACLLTEPEMRFVRDWLGWYLSTSPLISEGEHSKEVDDAMVRVMQWRWYRPAYWRMFVSLCSDA